MFTGITVKPSLLHGDLWSGNIAETIHEPGMCTLVCHPEFLIRFEAWAKLTQSLLCVPL